jgi:long-chain acyl-CoA synthetase
MDGYLGQEGETEAALRDGWLYTGDIARMDSEGYFQIISRKKDMWYAERDGQPTPAFPRDVEEVIYEIPEVKETAVVGIRNFPVAFVTCNRPIDTQTIMTYVGRRLA